MVQDSREEIDKLNRLLADERASIQEKTDERNQANRMFERIKAEMIKIKQHLSEVEMARHTELLELEKMKIQVEAIKRIEEFSRLNSEMFATTLYDVINRLLVIGADCFPPDVGGSTLEIEGTFKDMKNLIHNGESKIEDADIMMQLVQFLNTSLPGMNEGEEKRREQQKLAFQAGAGIINATEMKIRIISSEWSALKKEIKDMDELKGSKQKEAKAMEELSLQKQKIAQLTLQLENAELSTETIKNRFLKMLATKDAELKEALGKLNGLKSGVIPESNIESLPQLATNLLEPNDESMEPRPPSIKSSEIKPSPRRLSQS
jgi:hypothetical protein